MTFGYDDGDKLTDYNGTTIGYDAAGRPTQWFISGVLRNVHWDYEGRLDSATEIGGLGKLLFKHKYNGLGARVEERLQYSGTVTTTFKRDGVGVTAPVVSHVTGSTTTEVTPGIGQKVGSTKTYNHNGLKSVEAQSQSATSLSSTRVYDAWGAVVSSTGTHAGRFGHGGAYGYQSDSNDLQLLGHRFYDPNAGRFLTRDRIKDGRNWYAYCENNPLTAADPSGLFRLVVRGNDDDVLLSGLGYFFWEPGLDFNAGDVRLRNPTKEELIEQLINCTEFFFWGHGDAKGRLYINETEHLTQADLDYIEEERRKRGKPKLNVVHLAACLQCTTAEHVNNWMDITKELVAYPGVTASIEDGINRPIRFRGRVKKGWKPSDQKGSKKSGK